MSVIHTADQKIDMRDCLQRLYDPDGYQALCDQPYGVEHSHHDHTARQAAQLDLATCIEECHDWDIASPGVMVCNICHLVREIEDYTNA